MQKLNFIKIVLILFLILNCNFAVSGTSALYCDSQNKNYAKKMLLNLRNRIFCTKISDPKLCNSFKNDSFSAEDVAAIAAIGVAGKAFSMHIDPLKKSGKCSKKKKSALNLYNITFLNYLYANEVCQVFSEVGGLIGSYGNSLAETEALIEELSQEIEQKEAKNSPNVAVNNEAVQTEVDDLEKRVDKNKKLLELDLKKAKRKNLTDEEIQKITDKHYNIINALEEKLEATKKQLIDATNVNVDKTIFTDKAILKETFEAVQTEKVIFADVYNKLAKLTDEQLDEIRQIGANSDMLDVSKNKAQMNAKMKQLIPDLKAYEFDVFYAATAFENESKSPFRNGGRFSPKDIGGTLESVSAKYGYDTEYEMLVDGFRDAKFQPMGAPNTLLNKRAMLKVAKFAVPMILTGAANIAMAATDVPTTACGGRVHGFDHPLYNFPKNGCKIKPIFDIEDGNLYDLFSNKTDDEIYEILTHSDSFCDSLYNLYSKTGSKGWKAQCGKNKGEFTLVGRGNEQSQFSIIDVKKGQSGYAVYTSFPESTNPGSHLSGRQQNHCEVSLDTNFSVNESGPIKNFKQLYRKQDNRDIYEKRARYNLKTTQRSGHKNLCIKQYSAHLDAVDDVASCCIDGSGDNCRYYGISKDNKTKAIQNSQQENQLGN